VKVEFLVDIVPRDAPVGAVLKARLNSSCPDFAITPTFFGDGDGRATLLQSLRLRPDILVTPWYNADRTLEIWARARMSGAKLVHFPSEQFFSHSFDDEKLNASCADAYRRHVAAVFVWGQYYARRLVEDVGFPPERIYEVGSPRLEFARSEPPSAPREYSGRRPRRVLFVSDFTIADLRSESQRHRFTRTYGVPLSSSDVEQLGHERRYMLDTALRVTTGLNLEARVRPHPGEDTTLYTEACTGSRLEYADPTRQFSEDLAWADIVVGYTSTSVFEVLAAGRMFLALRSEEPPRVVWREALEDLYSKHTAETLLEYLGIEEPAQKGYATIERARYCIGNIDGAFDPVEALVSALEQVQESAASNKLTYHDSFRSVRGAARALAKFCAFRLFSSKPWQRLGMWQPSAVRSRLSPGHAVSDQILHKYCAAAASAPNASASWWRPVEWRAGRWCWSPVKDPDEGRDGRSMPSTAPGPSFDVASHRT
jgi:hypothetical protein